MYLNSENRRRTAGRIVVLCALLAGAFLFAGCSSDHPTAPDKPVAMKSGARGGHRGAAHGVAPGQTGQ